MDRVNFILQPKIIIINFINYDTMYLWDAVEKMDGGPAQGVRVWMREAGRPGLSSVSGAVAEAVVDQDQDQDLPAARSILLTVFLPLR